MKISVIIPAHEAQGTLARAIESVVSQKSVDTEAVICADDTNDYYSILKHLKIPANRLVLCRTEKPRSGSAIARNTAFRHCSSEWIACLDADDEFSPHRLQRLRPRLEETKLATGSTIEITQDGSIYSMFHPRHPGRNLTLYDIAASRMACPPVFHRSLFGQGWPIFSYCDDMLFNVDLFVRNGGAYGFVKTAGYRYYLSNSSLSASSNILRIAAEAYKKILGDLDQFAWPDDVKLFVRNTIEEDLKNAHVGLSNEEDQSPQKWRKYVRPK